MDQFGPKIHILSPRHQLYTIFVSSYSDIYYKTRSLGNLLININCHPNFTVNLLLYLLTTYNYYIWAEFAMCRVYMCRVCMGRVCYGPSLLCAELTRHLEIRWHRHCNKAVLYFVKHRESRIVAAIFEGAPAEVTQHRRNETMWDSPCGPPLHHFYLLYVLLGVRGHNFHQRFFFPAVRLWNSLAVSATSAPTMDDFKILICVGIPRP